MYRIEYLPIAMQDLTEIAQYIMEALKNKTAAMKTMEKITDSIERLAQFPYANPVHMPIRPLKHEFRKLPVENYLVFYWVENNTVTVARVIYAKREYRP
ncbi:MAG: type II toxin-antitoxin system RelE/ParE family toxin [Christensenellales bacterium]